jgi:hypothetical protein
MFVKGEDESRQAKDVRLPARAVGTDNYTDSTTIQYLNPSSAQIEYLIVKNSRLFDSPL